MASKLIPTTPRPRRWPPLGRRHARFAHAYFGIAAAQFTSRAKTTQPGGLYEGMAAVAMSAFCLEAYVNEIGTLFFSNWAKFERRLSTKNKLQEVVFRIGMTIDFTTPPFASYEDLFRLRNLVAHAKPGEVLEIVNLCDPASVETIHKNMRAMVREIHQAAGFGKQPFAITQYGPTVPGA